MTTEAMADVERRSDPNLPEKILQQAAAKNPALATALADAAAAIEAREPTGKPSWPLVLIEGGEKVGKTWMAVKFTASERVSASFMLDLGEGSADEYGAIPGANFRILRHDGSWRSIMAQVRAVAAYGEALLEAGLPPVCLIIDSATAEWKLNSEWADARARKRKKINNPDVEVQITMDLWNDATTRHYQMWNLLMRFPGIVIVTARGGEVAEVVGGQPTGKKTYRVEGYKNNAYDASVWIQLSRQHPGMVMGCRSVNYGIRPGVDAPEPIKQPDWDLEWLLFEALGLGHHTPQVRDMQPLHASGDDEPESKAYAKLRDLITRAKTVEQFQAAWKQVRPAVEANEMSADEGNLLKQIAGAVFDRLNAPAEPTADEAIDDKHPQQ